MTIRKNIMKIKTDAGYEVLYPQTSADQVYEANPLPSIGTAAGANQAEINDAIDAKFAGGITTAQIVEASALTNLGSAANATQAAINAAIDARIAEVINHMNAQNNYVPLSFMGQLPHSAAYVDVLNITGKAGVLYYAGAQNLSSAIQLRVEIDGVNIFEVVTANGSTTPVVLATIDFFGRQTDNQIVSPWMPSGSWSDINSMKFYTLPAIDTVVPSTGWAIATTLPPTGYRFKNSLRIQVKNVQGSNPMWVGYVAESEA
jgi:hypothetical protein